MNNVQRKLCLMTAPSLRTKRVVETPTLAVCGATGLPISAPTELRVGSKRGGGTRGCPRHPHTDPAEDRGHDDEPHADLGERSRERAGHARVVVDIGQAEDEEADEA